MAAVQARMLLTGRILAPISALSSVLFPAPVPPTREIATSGMPRV
jgi:hypothetical protein